MPSQGRTPQLPDLFPVHLGSSAIIFGVGITGCASMLAEEGCLVSKEERRTCYRWFSPEQNRHLLLTVWLLLTQDSMLY